MDELLVRCILSENTGNYHIITYTAGLTSRKTIQMVLHCSLIFS